jgi:prevent-host-death family protein
MDITKDIRPLTEFKRDTSRFVAHLKETGRPSVLTVNGKPELVIMDARAWQEMLDGIEFARAVADIRKGLAQADRGRGVEAAAFFKKLKNAKA